MSAAVFRLVVLGDSTSFTDDKGPQLPTEPKLYPNVVARELEEALDRPVAVSVVARAGTDVREAHRAILKDRHLMFEVLMGCDAVVVGIGSIDHAPTGIPPLLEDLARRIEHPGIRRRVRRALKSAYPVLTRATRGRFTHTSTAAFGRLYDELLFQVRALTQGVPGVALGPTSHRGTYYGDGHPQLAPRTALQARIAARQRFPFVAPWPLVEPFADLLNPDGIHWPGEGHAAVGRALAAPLIAQLRGEQDAPGIPW